MSSENPNVQIADSSFSDCFSEAGGGAILLGTHNSDFFMSRSELLRCSSVSGSGGALQFLEDNNNARIYMSSFYHNTAGVYGGALALITGNLHVMVGGCIFEKNSAAESGGIYMLFMASILVS